ncbi:MAG: hypothetical protein ABIH37_03610 [archaeon]
MFTFKKIATVLASAVMLSSTIGFAAAANYPSPFVVGGAEDAAIVVGLNADVSDVYAAIDIQDSLNALTTGGGTSTSISGTAWQVGTSSDDLELNESIRQITTYIDKEDLPILTGGSISNEKGTAKYEEYLYFEDVAAGSSRVGYQEDDDENIGLFFKIVSGNTFAKYYLDFTTDFKSDIATSTLEDIDDEEITFLGKTYTITKAENATSGVQLTLMSGAEKVTVSNGEEITAGGKTISVVVSSATQAQFTIDGETLNKLNAGDTNKLADGTYIGVSDITYQGFSGGLMTATIYIGADKIELFNGSSMTVNAITISDANVLITSTIANGDISISDLAVNMTAEDDLFIKENGKLSEATDLDKPQAILGQNWDIEYKGLDTTIYEEMSVTKSTDAKMKLKFENYDGNLIDVPLVFVNATGVFGGDREGYKLVLDAGHNITKNDYFILNTADPFTLANNAKSFVAQYKGSDKLADTDPKLRLTILGEGDKDLSLTATATASMKLGGATFNFGNVSTAALDDFTMNLTTADYTDGAQAAGATASLSNYVRTKYNALINITDTNESMNFHPTPAGDADGADWVVTLYLDDTNRDGDNNVLTAARPVFVGTYANSTATSAAEVATSITAGGGDTWVADNVDSTKSTFVTAYGAEVDYSNPSSSPASITVRIPDSAVKPLVFVSSGDITVTPGSTGGGGQVLVVKDNEVSSVDSKNLVVVGGSCINSVAAKMLGSSSPLCTADFTEATGVGSGEYIIKTAASPYNEEKIAMLVAGYEKAQTVSAVNKVLEGVATDVGTEQVYPIAA